MQRRRLWQLACAVPLVVLVAAVTLLIVRQDDRSTKPAGVASDRMTTIPVDGADLSAEVLTPQDAAKPPLVVMPASWGQPATEYREIAGLFARAGYQVVAYAQRGFEGSTGEVDFAGPQTQQDVTAVITWALAHTDADPQRVGAFGISYGAGISLLAAAKDPRIKAVAALSTWTDEGQSFDVHGTPSTVALGALLGSSHGGARFGSTVKHLQDVLHGSPATVGQAVRQISRPRSPATYVQDINRNHPAVMIANAYQDSIFPPAQLIGFYDALTTPKRLQLATGDHGGPELGALYGRSNETVDDARAWLDHYLRGVQNRIETEGPIILHDVRSGALRTYASWPAARSKDRYPLGRPGAAATAAITPTWQASIKAGTDSGAASGRVQYLSLKGYQPAQADLGAIKRSAAFVWNGPLLASGVTISGTPQLHVGVSSTSPTTTLFAYLYDVDADGTGNLMTMTPYTLTGLRATKATPATIPLQPISWSVPSGHHLALVLDTVDARYKSLTRRGATVTVSSTAADKATLVAPTATG